jgi:hypothetical protein
MSDRMIDNESSDTEGNRDSRSPREKRDSTNDPYEYSHGDVNTNMNDDSTVNPVAEEIWNENERSPKPDGWMGR